LIRSFDQTIGGVGEDLFGGGSEDVDVAESEEIKGARTDGRVDRIRITDEIEFNCRTEELESAERKRRSGKGEKKAVDRTICAYPTPACLSFTTQISFYPR